MKDYLNTIEHKLDILSQNFTFTFWVGLVVENRKMKASQWLSNKNKD